MEGLVAFFLESTFLGLWVFGRNLLSQRMHLATIWLAAFGTTASAYFILAANSFMHHPVGISYDASRNRVELTSIWKVLTNSTQLVTFPHTVLAAFMTAGALLLSVSAYHLRRGSTDPVHSQGLRTVSRRRHHRGGRGEPGRAHVQGSGHDRPAADENGCCGGALEHPVTCARSVSSPMATSVRAGTSLM